MLAQTLFQSASQGLISLINDRENDFSQEMFVAPISRYAIIFGKILGESLVALPQGITILLFGVLILRPRPAQVLLLLVASVLVSLFGGAFGVLVLANFASQQTANQVFTFVMLPQYFLAGVFYPIKVLPPGLNVLSFISPMRYAVDLARGLFYAGRPEYRPDRARAAAGGPGGDGGPVHPVSGGRHRPVRARRAVPVSADAPSRAPRPHLGYPVKEKCLTGPAGASAGCACSTSTVRC